MIEFSGNGMILSAESKPYDFDGKTGVSHRIRVAVDGEIYPCRANEDQVKEYKAHVGDSGSVVIQVASRKEAISLVLKTFKKK